MTWTPVVSLVTSLDISNFVSMLILFAGKERTRTASDGRKTARLPQLRQLRRTLKSSQSSLS